MRRKTKLSNGAEIVPDDLSFGLVAAVLNQESLIILKKYMMEWFDMKVRIMCHIFAAELLTEFKQWTDLEAGMRCFIQIVRYLKTEAKFLFSTLTVYSYTQCMI